jgi:hypothetical protein|nr:MAG TPA: tail assembly chaperone protein [Caudoviricetes sp.]
MPDIKKNMETENAAEEVKETKKAEVLTGEVEDNPLVINFARPFKFEDSTYNSVDLSGIENLRGRDMVKASKDMARSGDISVMPEMSMEYAFMMAAKAADLPVEFFYDLPPKECIKVKNRVTNFLYSAE